MKPGTRVKTPNGSGVVIHVAHDRYGVFVDGKKVKKIKYFWPHEIERE